MKILTVGCLHGDLTQAKKLVDTAVKEKVDLVVFNGDFTFGGGHTPGVFKAFKDKGLKIALLPGNHEDPSLAEFLMHKYGAINLHGYGMKFGDVGIFGCGAANIGIFQLPEDEIYRMLKEGFSKIENARKKIMFTHVHPHDTLIERLSGFPGSKGAKWAIDALQPDMHLSSHIHETEGLEEDIGNTKVISVGRHGKIIEI